MTVVTGIRAVSGTSFSQRMAESVAQTVPALPKLPFVPLRPRKLPVGERLVHYVKTKQSTVPDKFNDNCKKLDALRNELCDASEMLPERVATFVEYFKYASILTQGLDLTANGCGVCIVWNEKTFYDIEFDFVCLGFNVALGLLAVALRQDTSSEACLKVLGSCLTGAKGICTKIITLHKDVYNDVLPSSNLKQLDAYIDAFWVYLQLGVVLVRQSDKKGFSARVAKTAAHMFEALQPLPKDHAMFLNVFANIYMFYDLSSRSSYGPAIAYGKKAKALVPNSKDMKKIPDGIKGPLKVLVDSFDPKLTATDKENQTVYFDTVPAEPEEIPLLTNGTTCNDSVKWDVEVDAKPFQSTAAGVLEQTIEKRKNNFAQEIDRALKDIDTVMGLWPQALVDEAHALITNLYAQRTLARELTEEVSRLLGANSSAISARMPRVFDHFKALRANVDQAATADLSFETKYGQAQSLLGEMDKSRQALTQLKDQILALKRASDVALEEAAKSASSTNVDVVLQGSQKLAATFEKLAAQLNPIFVQVAQHVQAMKVGAERVIPPYTAEIAAVKTGFTQGTTCYAKINQQLQTIKSQLIQA